MMTSGIALSEKARPMKFYRCYFLSAANAIKGVAEFPCRDDSAALEHSRALLNDQPVRHGFELWEGSRRLHREFVVRDHVVRGGATKTGK